MPTYHFTVVLEQEGFNELDAWERLLGYIADAPTEAIDRYESAERVSDNDSLDDDEDGTSGQDRKSYTDTQDRDSYTVSN